MIPKLTDEEKQKKLKEFMAEYGETDGKILFSEMLNWEKKKNEVR